MNRLLLSFCLIVSCSLQVHGEEPQEKFEPLFNGKDFSGWVRTNTPESTWSYQDGMIVCTGKPVGEIRTEKMYQNFILELEWRHMVPKGNAGIFLFADDITAKGVPFHRGIEVQVLENDYGNTQSHTTHGDIFPIHGAKMVPVNGRGGDRAFPTENRSNPSPEWNHYRIVAKDGEVSLAVNGKVVTQGKKCSPSKGYICLESEGGVVHYRKVKIQVLPDSPIAEADVAISNRGYKSIYSGLDLSGWKPSESGDGKWSSQDWVLAYRGSEKITPLVSESAVENFGFVVDFKLNDEKSSFALQFLSAETKEPAIPVTAYTTLNANETLVHVGTWNRLEGTVVGSKTTFSLNGAELEKNLGLKGLADLRKIVLTPSGNVDFANLYIRKVD